MNKIITVEINMNIELFETQNIQFIINWIHDILNNSL